MKIPFFKKEKPIQIPIEEAEEWVKKNLSTKIEEKERKLETLYRELVKEFSSLKTSIDVLGKAQFKGEEKPQAVVNMTKDMVVKRGLALVNNILSLKYDVTYEGMREFLFSAEDALKDLESLTPKQAFILRNYFSNQGSELVEGIKRTREKLQEFREFLEKEGQTLRILDEVRENVNQYFEFSDKLQSLLGRKREIQETLKNLKKTIEGENNELKHILKGKEFKESQELEKKIKGLEKEIREKESKLRETLSGIIKPMKKFEYFTHKYYPLLPKDEMFIMDFIQKPLQTIKTKESQLKLKEMLLRIQRFSEEKRLELKGSEKSKISLVLKKLENEIPEAWKEIEEIKKQVDEIHKKKEKYSDVVERKRDLEESIQKNEKEIEELQKESKNLEEEEKTLKEEIQDIIKGIQEVLERVSGKKIIILTQSKE